MFTDNPVLTLMSCDNQDKFAQDIANAYFANPSHVRSLLNENCIEECVNYVLDSQTVELDMSDLPENQPLWTKSSRKNHHDKKANRRKGSFKRSSDRVHGKKWCGHVGKDYRWSWDDDMRRCKHVRVHHDTDIVSISDNTEDETRSFKCGDGTTISCTMSKDAWNTPVWDKEDSAYRSADFDWHMANCRMGALELDFSEDEFEDWDNTDLDILEDEIIEIEEEFSEEELIKYGNNTKEFSAQELADIVQKIATATPEQRAEIRDFFN